MFPKIAKIIIGQSTNASSRRDDALPGPPSYSLSMIAISHPNNKLIRRHDELLKNVAACFMLSAFAFWFGAYRSFSEITTHRQQIRLSTPFAQSKSHSDGTSSSGNDSDNKAINDEQKFSLAYHHSYGFFNDIPDHEWRRMQIIAHSAGTYENRRDYDPKYIGNDDDDSYWNSMPTNIFYGRNYDPNFSCRFEVRVGGKGDGPKFVCDPHRIPEVARSSWSSGVGNSYKHNAIDGDRHELFNRRIDAKQRCLVYSIGSGGNFRFEHGLQTLLGPKDRCEVHVFDGTDYSSIVPQQLDIHYHPWGLRRDHGPNTNDDYSPDENVAYVTGNQLSLLTYRSLSQTVKMLGHSGMIIDILKIDCEGCEWKTYVDWIRGSSLDGNTVIPPPRQVLVEMHRSPAPFARDFFDAMRNAGYVIFHKEPNLEGCRGECVEYAFLRLHPEFYS
ncbi:hypothetical protein ACHAXS_002119 [Conticribra weissflogii]